MRLRNLPAAPGLARLEQREVKRVRRNAPPIPFAEVVTVIPTYERGDLVVAAVESALAQTVTDHRVIVVTDGGEPPQLPPDPRLHLVSMHEHCGTPGVVRNVGIRLTRSRYVVFLDDDNSWEPNHLEVSLAAHRAGAKLTYTGLRQVFPDGAEGRTIAVPYRRKTLRNDSYIDTSTMVVRRSPAVRFSLTAKGGRGAHEDWNLAYRLSRTRRTELVPIVTVRYLRHGGGHMQQHFAP